VSDKGVCHASSVSCLINFKLVYRIQLPNERNDDLLALSFLLKLFAFAQKQATEDIGFKKNSKGTS